MLTFGPLVSIIIPVFNGSDYMREAIDSALAQTYPNIEIIVVNDGSTDEGETDRIALSYGNKIQYYSKVNGGVSSALNYGISRMHGEYFSWLSHDDVYLPNKIAAQVSSLQDYASSKMISICRNDTIDVQSSVIKGAKPHSLNGSLDWMSAVMYITQNGANGCSLLLPKSVFEEVGGFDETLRYVQDIFLWWKITMAGYGIVFCDVVGNHYRVHAKQLTQTGEDLYHKEARIIGQKLIPDFEKISTQKNNIIFEYAKNEAIHGNISNVHDSIGAAKSQRLFGVFKIIILRILIGYGKFRPYIRKAYYRITGKVKAV